MSTNPKERKNSLPRWHKYLKQVTKEAAQGSTKQALCRKYKLPHNIFYYLDFEEAYEKGRDKLSARVRQDILEASITSYNDRKLLAERLSLFSEPFKTKKMKTPEDARDLIATAIAKFTSGEINELSLNAISKAANNFIESFNQTILQQDIKELRAMLKKEGTR